MKPDEFETANFTSEAIERLARRCVQEMLLELEEPIAAALGRALNRVAQVLEAGSLPSLVVDIPLTTEEEAEAARFGFKSRRAIRITGRIAHRKCNIILLGRTELILPDAEFKRLLRLIVGLFEAADGFVGFSKGDENRGGEGQEEESRLLFPEGIDQATSRLRARLPEAVTGTAPTDFIEVQRRRMRVSTHRAYVSYDRAHLFRHPDETVRQLAARLPDN